ncbi:hypothetical protein H6G36_14550 [Anabaena minutissima FACHB-250]|nr:hypothetical protein [Anabaena minutissima FACHB-250]
MRLVVGKNTSASWLTTLVTSASQPEMFGKSSIFSDGRVVGKSSIADDSETKNT